MDYETLIEKLKELYLGAIYYKDSRTNYFELPFDYGKDKLQFIVKQKNDECFLCYLPLVDESDFCFKVAQRYGVEKGGKKEYYIKITSLQESEIKSAVSRFATFVMLCALKVSLSKVEFIEVNYVLDNDNAARIKKDDMQEIENTIRSNVYVDKSKIEKGRVYTIFCDKFANNLYFDLLMDECGVRVSSSINFECVRNSECFEALMSQVGLYVNEREKRVQSHPKYIDLSVYYVEDIMYYIIIAENIDLF